MPRKPRFLLAIGAALLAAGAASAATQAGLPPVPDRWLTDKAGFLSPGAAASLDGELAAFERRTGRQFVVYIDRTTGGLPLEDFTAGAFKSWRVGRRGLDDGLALFILTEDRRIRIEVGYGLEAIIPDITAGRIINDVIVPTLRSGENDRAVRDGIAALERAITGEGAGPAEGTGRTGGARKMSRGELVLAGIAGLFFLILFITNPRLALWLLFSLLSGGRGGGGGGGGGFRGGGGRSGGGGASGSW